MWDLWCTKWQWGRTSPSTSVPLANHTIRRMLHNHHPSPMAGILGQYVALVILNSIPIQPNNFSHWIHSECLSVFRCSVHWCYWLHIFELIFILSFDANLYWKLSTILSQFFQFLIAYVGIHVYISLWCLMESKYENGTQSNILRECREHWYRDRYDVMYPIM
jgi:hypothetical protein